MLARRMKRRGRSNRGTRPAREMPIADAAGKKPPRQRVRSSKAAPAARAKRPLAVPKKVESKTQSNGESARSLSGPAAPSDLREPGEVALEAAGAPEGSRRSAMSGE